MSNPIQHLANGNLEKFRETVHSVLYAKLGNILTNARQNIAEEMYGNKEKPGQSKKGKKGKNPFKQKESC
jgi:hypothetical protein